MTIIRFGLERTFGLHRDIMSILIYWLVGQFRISPIARLHTTKLLMVSARACLKNDSQGVMPKSNKKWFWEPILIINNNNGQTVKLWLELGCVSFCRLSIHYSSTNGNVKLFLPFMFHGRHGYPLYGSPCLFLLLHVLLLSFLSPLSKLSNFFCFSFHFTSLEVTVTHYCWTALFHYINNLKFDC